MTVDELAAARKTLKETPTAVWVSRWGNALLDEVERLRGLVRDYRENSPNVEEMSGFELKNTEWLGLDERAKEVLGDE